MGWKVLERSRIFWFRRRLRCVSWAFPFTSSTSSWMWPFRKRQVPPRGGCCLRAGPQTEGGLEGPSGATRGCATHQHSPVPRTPQRLQHRLVTGPESVAVTRSCLRCSSMSRESQLYVNVKTEKERQCPQMDVALHFHTNTALASRARYPRWDSLALPRVLLAQSLKGGYSKKMASPARSPLPASPKLPCHII